MSLSRTDQLIVACAALLVAALYGTLWQPVAAGSEVSIWVAGAEHARLPLDQDRDLEVRGSLGISAIQIRDGRVRVVESPGAQRICIRAGWLSQAGESAICLPNQVVVQVEGADPRFDAMNF